MARRRFGPLVVSVVLATLVLALRLAQVQLGAQSEVWADEARTLVRVGRVVPYRRGDLLDRDGRVLAHDLETYRVVFVQREFRREHPLGQVAHAISAIEQRCVPLAEAYERLDELAPALAELTPDELEAFGRGAALEHGPLRAPALTEQQRKLAERWSRRGDVVFYVVRLLGLRGREAGALARLVREQPARRGEPYLELVARVLATRAGSASSAGAVTADDVRAELRARLDACREDLEGLAQLLAVEPRGAPRSAGQGALGRLLERLEGWRATVEDGAASDLFQEACGFWPGRMEPRTLLGRVDLGWIEALLRWEPARVEAWLGGERDWWLRYQGLEGDLGETYQLQQLALEAELAPAGEDRIRLVRERWTEPFLTPPQAVPAPTFLDLLRGVQPGPPRRLAVFHELDELFESRPPADARPSATELFAFQDPGWIEAGAADACEALARAELWLPDLSPDELERLEPEVQARAQEWRAWREDFERERVGRMRTELVARTRERWRTWEEVFQARLAGELTQLARSGRAEDTEPLRLRLADGRLDRAAERVRFALRDHGGRSAVVVEAPAYELVHLLSRRPASFAGFVVERSHERVRARIEPLGAGEPRAPLVSALLGTVRTPRLRDLYERRPDLERFRELQQKGERTPAETDEFEELVERTLRHDETYGSDGLEGYLNSALAGHNGYVEELGLQEDLERGGRPIDVAPLDGLPVELTLKSDLQLAALEVLEHPRRAPVDAEKLDPAWLARPTGAIVLLDVSGDVLAMASYPDRPRGQAGDPADQALERTLRLYDAQPPGSVMKPFVAAWALDRLGLDRHAAIECSRRAHPVTGRAGYNTVHCSFVDGHGEHVDLEHALRRSCNSYFAWVGDTRYQPADYLQMYAAFGFGQPTGILSDADGKGLPEDGDEPRFQPSERALAARRSLMLACNGLGAPQTTVMQVARAYAGLATGSLPEVRLVSAIGGRPVPARARELPLRADSLATVRAALVECANDMTWELGRGSAAPALNRKTLGLAPLKVAAKTGSADLRRADADGESRVLKHTWLASFFPSDRPRYVLVVFCYQTYATSGASSIWLAQQFLQHPAVTAWLRDEGLVE